MNAPASVASDSPLIDLETAPVRKQASERLRSSNKSNVDHFRSATSEPHDSVLPPSFAKAAAAKNEGSSTSGVEPEATNRDSDPLRALNEAMERFPNSYVAAVGANGYFVPPPASLVLGDHPLATGRSALDFVVPADRLAVIEAWERVLRDGISIGQVHFSSAPETDVMMFYFDVRADHGVVAVVFASTQSSDAQPFLPVTSNLPARLIHMTKDAHGNILEVDETVAQILGWKSEDLVGRRSTEFIHHDDLDRAIGSWFEMLGSLGAISRCRYRHRRSDGSWCWVDTINVNRLDRERAVVTVEIIDVSDEMAAIEALRSHERLLANLTEALPIGVMQIDQGCRVTYTNGLFGELVGAEHSSVPSDHLAMLAGAERRRFDECLDEALLGIEGEFEAVCTVPGGEYRAIHLTFRLVEMSADGDEADKAVLVSAMDVTSRRRAEATTEFQLLQLNTAQRFAQLGSFSRDPKTNRFEVSDEGCRLFGVAPSATLAAEVLLQRVHGDDLPTLKTAMTAAVKDFSPIDLEFRIVLPEGERRWVHAKGGWVAEDALGEGRVVTSVFNITERKLAAEALDDERRHDKLTGLINRGEFFEQLERALSASAHQGIPVAVLLLDVDDFKTVNDSLGHAIGDELLLDLSRRLVLNVSDRVVVARFGGDEFAMFIESDDVRHAAEQLAMQFIDLLQSPFSLVEHEVKLSASIGVAFSDQSFDSSALMRDADIGLYLAKQRGRGRYEIAEPEMHERALERLEMIADLYRGVENDEFEVYYQAIVDTETSVVSGAEALVRWNHPRLGLVTPHSFIETAESSGVIVVIGQQVRRRACRQLAAWRRAGVVDDDFVVGVNVSPRQLTDPDLVDHIVRDLADAGLPARALVIEVTEGAVIGEPDEIFARLRGLRDLGVRIAIDDYGTGYSSLARLSEMPIDIVKIDKLFIDQLLVSPKGFSIVKSVIDAAKALGMSTTAEGVEEIGQRDALAELGCDFIQGYLFSKPVPAAKALGHFFELRAHSDEWPTPMVGDRDNRVALVTSQPRAVERHESPAVSKGTVRQFVDSFSRAVSSVITG